MAIVRGSSKPVDVMEIRASKQLKLLLSVIDSSIYSRNNNLKVFVGRIEKASHLGFNFSNEYKASLWYTHCCYFVSCTFLQIFWSFECCPGWLLVASETSVSILSFLRCRIYIFITKLFQSLETPTQLKLVYR